MKVGAITLMTALLLAWPALAGPPPDPCAGSPDTDGDGCTDVCDNCIHVANPSQTDCDSDGFGNVCDGDFDQNNIVAGADFNQLLTNFGGSVCLYDIGVPDPPQPDGLVAGADFNRFLQLFGSTPGPSGTSVGPCP